MRTIYSKEDSRQLATLNGQLSDYDAQLLSRLSNELQKDAVLLRDTCADQIRGEMNLKTAFLNDLGRKEILAKIERFYAVTMPVGIELD